MGNYVIFNVESGIYEFEVDGLPQTAFPDPLNNEENLALLGRISASSMFIKTEKIPEFEAFKANDEKDDTRWLAAEANDQYLKVDWVKPQTFNKVVIDEIGDNITSYKIQYWNEGEWKDIVNNSGGDANEVHSFEAVTTKKSRVFIGDSKEAPSISELKIYHSK